MKKILKKLLLSRGRSPVALLFLPALFILAGAASAAVPAILSYQATLRKSGALFTGTAAMEFRITSADGSVVYWTSGSTNVAVTSGLFRYPLGADNAGQFAAVPWGAITPYVQMQVDGAWLPNEPLYSSAYSLHSLRAEASDGSFTAYNGDIRISTTSGSRGVVFQDGSVQYSAVVGAGGLGNHIMTQNLVTNSHWISGDGGNEGISIDASGAILSSSLSGAGNRCVYVDGTGVIRAKGSDCGTAAGAADDLGNHIMTQNLVTGSHWISYDGSAGGLTVNISSDVGIGVLSAGTRLDVKSAPGDSYVQFWRDSGGTLVASMTAAGVLYADASGLRGGGSDNLGNHVATTTLNMNAFNIANAGNIAASSFTAAGAAGVGAAQVLLAGNVAISSETSAALGAGVRISSNVYIVGFSSAAVYYGDGSKLTGVAGIDNLGNHVATTTLNMNTFNIANAGNVTASSFTASGASGVGSARVRLAPNVSISSETGAAFGAGVRISSNVYIVGFSSAAAYYGDGSKLTGVAGTDNLGNHTATTTLNMNNFGLVNVASMTAGGYLTTNSTLTVAGNAFSVGTSTFVVTLGNVGIGMTNPAARLNVNGSVLFSGASNGVPVDGELVYNNALHAYEYYDLSALTWKSLAGGNITVTGGNWVLDGSNIYYDSGNVGIGTILPGAKLEVGGQVKITGGGPASGKVLTSDAAGLASWQNVPSSADNLGNHTATTVLNMNSFGIDNAAAVNAVSGNFTGSVTASSFTTLGAIGVGDSLGVAGAASLNTLSVAGDSTFNSATASSFTALGASGIGAAQLHLANNVSVSSETSQGLGGGVRISSNVYVVGFSSAAVYYGDGSKLTGLPASDNLGNHIAAATLNMNNFGIINVASITASGYITVSSATVISSITIGGQLGVVGPTSLTTLSVAGISSFDTVTASSFTAANAAGVGAPQLRLAANVSVSSTASQAYGGGVMISSNVYIMGFSSASIYYGDGSKLTGVSFADTLGTHVATTTLNMAGFGLINVASIAASGYMTMSSATIASNMGVGGTLGVTGATSLTALTATGAASLTTMTVTGASTFNSATASSFTALSASGIGAAQLRLAANVSVSSNTDQAYGGGVIISSNVYIVGFSSASIYYGDGSKLTGISGTDNLGNHVATTTLNMNTFGIDNAGFIRASYADFGNSVTASSFTARNPAGISAAQLRLADNVSVSSNTGQAYGGGVMISTNVYIVGFSSATKYFGDGSNLTGITATGSMNNPATGDLQMNSKNISGVNNIDAAGHMAVGNQSAVGTTPVLLVMEQYEQANITNYNVGQGGISLVNPTSNWGAGYFAIGGNFRGGIGDIIGNTTNKDFDTLMGIRTTAWTMTSGTVSSAYAIYAQNEQTKGTVTNSAALFADTPNKSGGAITNNYGIYINDQSGVGTAKSYNLYSAGTASKNQFDGQVSIGNTATGDGLHDKPLEIRANSNSELMRLDLNATDGHYCVILIEAAPTCSGGETSIGMNSSYSVCLKCS